MKHSQHHSRIITAIRRHMDRQAISNQSLALMLELPTSKINHWLDSRRDIPAHYLPVIASSLGCNITDFFADPPPDVDVSHRLLGRAKLAFSIFLALPIDAKRLALPVLFALLTFLKAPPTSDLSPYQIINKVKKILSP